MTDLRGYDAPAPEQTPANGKSKIIAGAIVALMLGAAGVYVYAGNTGVPAQPQKVAMSEPQQFNAHPQPLTPPPAPVSDTTTTTDTTAAPDVTPPPEAPAAKAAPSASAPRVQHEAHVRTPTRPSEPSTVPAATPPDTTTIPEIPAQPATPQATPPASIPQATPPVTTEPPPTVDQPPQSTTPQDGGTPQ